MEEYTWDDIIINPNSEQAQACIGKEVYYATNPTELLTRANKNNIFALDELLKIYPKNREPFKVNDALSSSYTCIILKKEESQKDKHKEYMPFKNSGEFISEFEDNTPIMHIYGLWVYEKIGEFDERVPRLVTELWGDGVVIGSDKDTTKWEELLEKFVFENNEPCGKLQEEK